MVDKQREYILSSSSQVYAPGIAKRYQQACITNDIVYKKALRACYPTASDEVFTQIAKGEYRVDNEQVIVGISTT